MLFWLFCYGPSSYRAQSALLLTTFAELEPLCRTTIAMIELLFSNGLGMKISLNP